MKAAYYTRHGEPEVLTYGDLPDPVAGDEDVVVEVKAVSIEGGDVLRRRNFPPENPPHIGGYAAAGVIRSIGSGVSGLVVGQRVACFNWAGSHAELFKVPQQFAFPIPDALETEAAAAGLISFGTAHDALFEFGRLERGETVLIQGAAGGVGLAAVQLAARAGARVIATASSGARLDRLRSYGVTNGIDYRQEDIGVRAQVLTDDRGVDLVIDLAGGKAHGALIDALRYRGRYAIVGAASGERVTFTSNDIAIKGLTVMGAVFGLEIHTARVRRLVAEIFDDMAAGQLAMPIDSRFPLAEAAKAHRHAEEGHPFGRIVLIP